MTASPSQYDHPPLQPAEHSPTNAKLSTTRPKPRSSFDAPRHPASLKGTRRSLTQRQPVLLAPGGHARGREAPRLHRTRHAAPAAEGLWQAVRRDLCSARGRVSGAGPPRRPCHVAPRIQRAALEPEVRPPPARSPASATRLDSHPACPSGETRPDSHTLTDQCNCRLAPARPTAVSRAAAVRATCRVCKHGTLHGSNALHSRTETQRHRRGWCARSFPSGVQNCLHWRVHACPLPARCLHACKVLTHP